MNYWLTNTSKIMQYVISLDAFRVVEQNLKKMTLEEEMVKHLTRKWQKFSQKQLLRPRLILAKYVWFSLTGFGKCFAYLLISKLYL